MATKKVLLPEPHSLDRGLALSIAITLLAQFGEPEFVKLLDGLVKKVGKENAGPVLISFETGICKVIAKNKIK